MQPPQKATSLPPALVTVTLRSLASDPMAVEINTNAALEEVAETYAAAKGVEPSNVRFIHNGRDMENQRRPCEYHVQDGGIIFVVIRTPRAAPSATTQM